MNSNFKEKYGKWAVITGGTSGIGQSLTHLIAAQGVNIVLVARRETVLAVKAKVFEEKYGVKVKTVQADLSKAEDVPKVIEQTKDLDVGLFIPCAGIENHGLITDIALEKELALIQLNVTSTFVLTHHFAKTMVTKGKGGILLVASTIAHMPNPYFSNYAGSKAYVLNFGLSLHWEMKKKGVDVTVLSPGYTTTPMTANFESEMDMSKMPFTAMTPQEVAQEAINALGRKPLIIPGKKNRLMVNMGRRLMSTSKTISMGGKMMEKVLNPN